MTEKMAIRLVSAALLGLLMGGVSRGDEIQRLFGRENLIAWCIVPFDSIKRGPEERAAMLERLGFKHFAYDWRAEHVASFDAEVEALQRHGVGLDAFWVAPGELNKESRLILDVLTRHHVKAELWALLDLGQDKVTGAEQERRVAAAVEKLGPLAKEAGKAGCSLALYNHGGWFGEPKNQSAIVKRLKKEGVGNVGVVYNLHHGHDHIARLADVLKMLKPYLTAVNLNGMDPEGDRVGRKILPLGQGSKDLEVLKTILESGYRGRIGILGHTMDDAEARLRDNLDGLDWLLPQLEGKAAGPKPVPRTPVPPRPAKAAEGGSGEVDRARVARLMKGASEGGNAKRGAAVFVDPRLGCVSCHKIGGRGGIVGPDLTEVGKRLTAEGVVESLLWPSKEVKPEYAAVVAATTDGRMVQGYKESETAGSIVLRDPSTGEKVKLAREDIEALKNQGTLMPEGLAGALTTDQQWDLVRFLTELGKSPAIELPELAMANGHGPGAFVYERGPLQPDDWPGWRLPVNRDRVYDFYAKEAEAFVKEKVKPGLLPEYPGLDGGRYGHWGNQNEKVWTDARWNETNLGSVLSGVFRQGEVVVAKSVCVRLGEKGEVSACFNPETLCYEAAWRGGFVRFSAVRHGFMEGLIADGTSLGRPEGKKPAGDFVYHGFYRQGKRVVFSYRIGGTEYLDAPWVDERGEFKREVTKSDERGLTKGGPAQWPEVIRTKGVIGKSGPYAVDTIGLPFENPWKALMFVGDHDFLADGSALICTMQGDVWRAEGLDERLEEVRWRRVASGLHQALGLVVSEEKVYVLGRDQITRLNDLNGDGEYDFYECVNNAFFTSTAGHDFVCGLQREKGGDFLTVSGKQGLLRVEPDGKRVEVLATGFRNPDGLGISPEGTVSAPSSEGDWVPASMICEVKPGGYYGYGGPREGKAPELPLVYLPRGLDNSSGGQVFVESDRWGPLKGQMLHFSYGAGAMFLILREQVEGQPQGASTPMAGEFRSGVHRGRFSPRDGQLYVSGMGGWGTYTTDDGCFQRVRYTGEPVQTPVGFHVHQNGVMITFAQALDREAAGDANKQFAQAWNYRYSEGYGSRELSPRHPGLPGHDLLAIRSATVLGDGKSLFLEMPELQPVNQLHLHMRVDSGRAHDLFATVHKLGAPFTGFAGYRAEAKTIGAHPMLSDLAMSTKSVPNPFRKPIARARDVVIEAGKNLSFSVRSFEAKPGEAIKLTFKNPDVVPHNWVLIRPGTLASVGDMVNKIIADPEAVARHYVPKTEDVLVYTDMVYPEETFSASFRAPEKPGRYPFLCTFPGHWMVMNGEMMVR